MSDSSIHSVCDSDDEVSLLSRLLCDDVLRRRFCDDRDAVAAELTECPSTAAFLTSLNAAQLEAQAETLTRKRQHEVAQILAATWQSLGSRAVSLFETYVAASAWPAGHNRHMLDAEGFGLWLRTQGDCEPVSAELNRVRFAVSGRRFSMGLVRWGVMVSGFQLLFKDSNGQSRDLIIGVGQPSPPNKQPKERL
jgi:hypothetical protein